MEKRYLVLFRDGPEEESPAYVLAETKEQALALYCRKVQSKDEIYRDYVQDNSIDGFLATLLISYEQRTSMAEWGGIPRPPTSVVNAKIREFFSSHPTLGEAYISFVERGDPTVLCEDIYEFISERDTKDYIAIEESTIPMLRI